MTRIHTAALAALLAAAATLTACGRQQDDELGMGRRAAGPVPDVPMAASQAAAPAPQVDVDLGITAKVNAALAADEQLRAAQINVDTHDGAVTLSGHAPDARLRERATTLTTAVDGVRQVSNQLTLLRGG